MAVKVTVNTTISNGNEKETFELTTFGRYYIKEKSTYLQYEEMMEEGNIKTIVKVSEEDALILRSGAIKMRLPFVPQKHMNGSYETPYGTLATSVLANKIEHQYNPIKKQGQIYINYELKIQGSTAGTYELSIKYEEERK